MIEQTDLVVTEWHYHEYIRPIGATENIPCSVTLEVMKKRNSQKKGLACRFTCQFKFEKALILEYVGEDSYIIDFEDVINKSELLRMLQNSYSKFKTTFDFRKLSTILHDRSLMSMNESMMDLDAILPLLV